MNFEKFHRDIQVEDLYYFLRKVMEKSGWKLRLGDGMLNAYSAIHPLTRSETEYLKIRLDLSGKVLENIQSVLQSTEKAGFRQKRWRNCRRFLHRMRNGILF